MALMWLLEKEDVFGLLESNWEAAGPVLEMLALGMLFRLGYRVSRTAIMSDGAVYGITLRNT